MSVEIKETVKIIQIIFDPKNASILYGLGEDGVVYRVDIEEGFEWEDRLSAPQVEKYFD